MLSDEEFFGELKVGDRVRKGQVIDEVSVTGLEIVRSNASPDTKEVMQHVLHIILYEDDLMAMKPKVKEKWLSIINGRVPPEQVGIPVGIQKPLDQYGGKKEDGSKKGTPYHIKAAQYSNTWLNKNIGVGDKPLIYYVSDVPRNFEKTHVIAIERGDDWPEGFELDWEQHAKVCIENPLNNLLRGVGLDFEEVVSDFENVGAMDFF
jgi:DNA polymerase elongation subunit (family B)